MTFDLSYPRKKGKYLHLSRNNPLPQNNSNSENDQIASANTLQAWFSSLLDNLMGTTISTNEERNAIESALLGIRKPYETLSVSDPRPLSAMTYYFV
jgi:hypothetical protein